MRPRIVILADGISTPNNLIDRHFHEIGGEELLPRSIRQFGRWGEVEVLTSNQKVIDRLPPVTIAPGSNKSRKYRSIDMIRKGLERCGKGRTIIVFGDVYFTDQAVQVIKEGNNRSWAVYGRSQGNPYTGTPWAEYFAIEMGGAEAASKGFEALEAVIQNYETGLWSTAKTWDWYYEMEGMLYYIEDVANVPTGEHWVEINDLTDDVDFFGDIIHLREAVERDGG